MADPQIFDDYTIIRPEIARGGSSLVHEACAPDGKRVAIKILDRETIESKVMQMLKDGKFRDKSEESTEFTEETRKAYELNVARFKEEYSTLLKLNHPNLAKVYKIGFHEGHFYIVSEFIDGKPIAEYVRGWKPTDMRQLFIEFLEGLDFIHRNGLIHLDIKSENILVQEANGKPHVKIIDFGLAMTPKEYRGSFLGSVGTMAPEVALGLKDRVDTRADLYSAGMVMYYCITWGFFPYSRPAATKREVIRRMIKREETLRPSPPSSKHRSRPGYVPEYLDKIVMRIIAYNPEDRFYVNAQSVANALKTHEPDAFHDSPKARGAYLKPIGDRHVGHQDIQRELSESVEKIRKGERPSHPIFLLSGESGVGKTHLMNKCRNEAERFTEEISIRSIALPAGEEHVERWASELSLDLSEGSRPIAVFIDKLDEITDKKIMALPLANKVSEIVKGLAGLASEQQDISEPAMSCVPFILIGTVDLRSERDILAKLNPKDEICRKIYLKPFGPDETREYIASTPAFKYRPPPDEWVDTLHRRTGGIAGALVDYLEGQDSQGLLFGMDGGVSVPTAEVPSAAPPARTPPSIHERLVALYLSLSPQEKEIADLVAVWNHKKLAPAITASDAAGLLQQAFLMRNLNSLEGTGVIETHDGTLNFSNDYFNSVVYERLGDSRRRAIHDSIALHLSKRSPADTDAIALHAGYGGDARRARLNLIALAKRQLHRLGRARLAGELFKRTLDLIDANGADLKALVLGLASESLFYQGDNKRAEELCKSGLKLVGSEASSRSRWIEISLYNMLIPILLNQKLYGEAERILDEAEKICAGTRWPAISILTNYRARMHYMRSLEDAPNAKDFLLKAKSLYKKGLELEKMVHESGRRRITNNHLFIVLRALGESQGAVSALKIELDRRDNNIFSAFSLHHTLAETYRMLQKYEDALSTASALLNIAKKMGVPTRIFLAHQVMANILHDMDRFEESMEHGLKCLAACAFVGDKAEREHLHTQAWGHMGRCSIELGRWAEAEGYFEACEKHAREGMETLSVLAGLGEVYLHQGKNEEAVRSFERAGSIAEKLPEDDVMKSYRYRISRNLAEIAIRSGDDKRARELTESLEHLAADEKYKIKEIDSLRKRIASSGSGRDR